MVTGENLLIGILSIGIALGIFFTIRTIIKIKLRSLKGTQKMLGLISIAIIALEGIFLALNFDLFKVATEVIASVGVAFALVVWAIQNTLKNAVAGIGIYLNPEIDVGDIIEVEGVKGVIIELHLTKITAMTEEGVKFFIPTQKIHEEVTLIYPRRSTN